MTQERVEALNVFLAALVPDYAYMPEVRAFLQFDTGLEILATRHTAEVGERKREYERQRKARPKAANMPTAEDGAMTIECAIDETGETVSIVVQGGENIVTSVRRKANFLFGDVHFAGSAVDREATYEELGIADGAKLIVTKVDVQKRVLERLGEYEGQLSDDGKRHGVGRVIFSSGTVYEGEWQDDKYHGFGKYISSKWLYEGEWQSDLRHGAGIFWTSPDDREVYEGEWQDGKMHGAGKLWSDAYGRIDEGQWREGVRQGSGKMIWSNGAVYEGEWSKTGMHGHGKFMKVDGGVLEGRFQDNKLHGFGKSFGNNGDKYEGEWQDGKINGAGKYFFADGREYEGEWQDNKKHGKGIQTSASGGVTYEGEWQDDKNHGKGKLVYADGREYEGEWENGKPTQKTLVQIGVDELSKRPVLSLFLTRSVREAIVRRAEPTGAPRAQPM